MSINPLANLNVPLSRREMLRRTRHGIWLAGAWRSLLGGDARSLVRASRQRADQSARAQAPHFAATSQARDPLVHEWRAVARRHVRSQARADQARTARSCRSICRPSGRPARRFPRRSSSSKYGQSGIEVSELFAHVAESIDDIAVIRSMHGDSPNHEPSLMLMNCGEPRLIRAQHGLVAHLRPGNRKPEPARLHRHVPRRLSDSGIAKLAVGLSARRAPGHLHRHQAHRDREADRAHRQPRDSARRLSGGSSTCWHA